MSFFLHKGCEQVPVVNSEEEESPPSYLLREYPLGYVMLAQAKGIPESCPDLCRATENVNRPAPDRIAAHHLEQGDHAASGLAASLGLLILASGRDCRRLHEGLFAAGFGQCVWHRPEQGRQVAVNASTARDQVVRSRTMSLASRRKPTSVQ